MSQQYICLTEVVQTSFGTDKKPVFCVKIFEIFLYIGKILP